jgi:hypothetical protein
LAKSLQNRPYSRQKRRELIPHAIGCVALVLEKL